MSAIHLEHFRILYLMNSFNSDLDEISENILSNFDGSPTDI